MNSVAFKNEVDLKYKLYNSIFLTLPLDEINGTGIMIPILSNECINGLQNEKSPFEILEFFFAKHTSFHSEKEKQDFMFRVIQYIERQVVLLDAVEDAAFEKVTDLDGTGSLRSLIERINRENKLPQLRSILENFAVRLVLTAHPTQFYPGSVLGIINDLIEAIQKNDLLLIQTLLKQLGKTPFFKKERPTPFDEAINLSWYLENIFYHSASDLYKKILQQAGIQMAGEKPGRLISLGFWPGGDRDGNPFVTTNTSLQVADNLRQTLLNNYYLDLRILRRRLSFKGVYEILLQLEDRIHAAITEPDPDKRIHFPELWAGLKQIEEILMNEHDSFFIDLLHDLKNKLILFGFHFASIDIRQDSRMIRKAFDSLMAANPQLHAPVDQETDFLFNLRGLARLPQLKDAVISDTLSSFRTIREIQRRNGEAGCNRYIISNCQSPADVARVFALARLCAWEDSIPLDIVPLFETIDDLENAAITMKALYEHPVYRVHLESRNLRQTVMLGFSDGTKDGGYFAANWNIYKAKENITRLSRVQGIEVLFFDGRGGPPARRGENTHKFYSSLGSDIENKEIQVTIQGQTVSSKFGTVISAEYYMELLITAGLENQVFIDDSKQLSPMERNILESLAQLSMAEYKRFRSSDKFVPYLEKMSVLKYYSQANIGSRPGQRNHSESLKFEDLRAIPFVGAWSQMKQNVPGFFGVGTSLKTLEKEGKLEACKDLYANSSFFRTLVENSMQSLRKSYFPLTQYMEKDLEFGDFWKWIYNEYLLSIEMLLKISGQQEMMESSPFLRESIALRASIVLPLVVIQQYAMIRLREMEKECKKVPSIYQTYEKLVIRSLYGNINASRNSV
jgi:phosphoenolpyruvate carboxylase